MNGRLALTVCLSPWSGSLRGPRWAVTCSLLFCLMMMATAGCRTVPPLEPVDLAGPGWSIHRGQALWRPRTGAPEVAGQILIASNVSGEDFIRFSKGPMEIVLARRNRQGWTLEMPAFNRSYSGRGHPPGRSGWFQLANAVCGHPLLPGWEWSGMEEGRWKLIHPKTGERLEGFFSQ